MSYQDAALIEPLACVLRGLEETGVQPGDTVAVMGLGPIGSMFVRLAKVYGAASSPSAAARASSIGLPPWAPTSC